MIKDLYNIGLNEQEVDEIIDELGYDEALNLSCNYELIKKNIDLLKSYGIKNIKQLIIYKEDLFLKNINDIVKMFSSYNIPVFVSLINEDVTTIDELF